MIDAMGLSMWAECAGILVASPAVEVRRTVAERAHMNVVVRTLGRDASVADWLTKLFQATIVLRPLLASIQ
jgi:hypothetical protein